MFASLSRLASRPRSRADRSSLFGSSSSKPSRNRLQKEPAEIQAEATLWRLSTDPESSRTGGVA